MKIAFIVSNEYPGIQATGGIGVFVRNCCLGLKEYGIEANVILLSSMVNERVEEIKEGVKIYKIPYPSAPRIIPQVRRLLKLLKEIDTILNSGHYDWVEISTSDSFLFRKLKFKNVIARTHGSLSYALKHYYKKSGFLSRTLQLRHEKNLLTQAKKIICISRQYLEHYKNYENCILIPNFIGKDYDTFSDDNLTFENPYLFFHGTIKDIKGVKELAIGFMRSRYAKSHKLILAGKGSTSYLNELKQICGDTLIHRGECNAHEIKRLLHHCALAVYPSKRDAFNLAVVEAMSQKALILTSSAIDSEIVSDDVNALVCPLDELDKLEYYINRAMEIPELKKNLLKEKAYETFSNKYSYDVGINANVSFYRSITA